MCSIVHNNIFVDDYQTNSRNKNDVARAKWALAGANGRKRWRMTANSGSLTCPPPDGRLTAWSLQRDNGRPRRHTRVFVPAENSFARNGVLTMSYDIFLRGQTIFFELAPQAENLVAPKAAWTRPLAARFQPTPKGTSTPLRGRWG